MISLKDFMEVVGYRITEGSDYWGYEGRNYSFTYWNGDQDGCSASVVFNTDTQEVLVAEVCDYQRERAYRLLSPNIQPDVSDTEAWDSVKWTDLETEEDWMSKARAIVNGEEYDERVSVPIDFSDEELLKYMIMAHEKDMSFNEFVEEALRNAIEEFKRDPEGMTARARAFVAK